MSLFDRRLLSAVAGMLGAVGSHARGRGDSGSGARPRGAWSALLVVAVGVVAACSLSGVAAGAALGASCPNAQFRTGAGASLPDCRAYEQVSPTDKGGYDVHFPADAVAVDGDSITWTSRGAFAGEQSDGITNEYLSNRGGLGWSTEGIEPKFSTLGSNGAAFGTYLGWSADLKQMVVAVLVLGESPHYFLRNPDGSFTPLDPNETTGSTSFGQFEGASPDFSQILFLNEEWAGGVLSPQVPTTVASQCTTGETGQAGPGGNCATGSVSLPPTAFANGEGVLTSTAYFTSREELTNDANTGPTGGGMDLYGYDSQTSALTDVSADSNSADSNGANVAGVVGTSADGSYVYFVASGALASGAGSGTACLGLRGPCNLYMWHDGTVTFIAPLTPRKDQSDWNAHAIASAQVSGDGAQLVFTSTASLTGYDNAGFSEIFRYDATTGSLSCASCNPSGAPATGNAELSQPYTTGSFPQQANISTDGSRVFFETPDALVPGDTNGAYDAYEWEADGTGSCQSASDNGGCLDLISTGKSTSPSFFEGANPSGNDVFFAARDQLVGQDQDGNYDIYDARVDGGLASQTPLAPASCSGTACQGPPSAAPAAVTAASVTFTGAGNLAGAPPGVTVKPTAKAKLLTKVVRGTSFFVRVRVPGKGRVTISAGGIRRVTRSVGKAGTYRLKVTLTAKSKRKLKQKRKLKLALKIGYAPAGAKPSEATVRLTVEPARVRHATHKPGGGR